MKAILLAALLLGLAPDASAHGGLFRSQTGQSQSPPPPPTNPNAPGGLPGGIAPKAEVKPVPGSTPSLAFSEERWEFWWEFNHDAYVNLRPSLANAPVAAGGAGFQPFDAAGRAQVVLPALIELLRDKDDQVRSAAVYSLARLEDASTLPYLSNAAVSDPHLSVRTHATLALGLARQPKA